jgi:hypothetical protein
MIRRHGQREIVEKPERQVYPGDTVVGMGGWQQFSGGGRADVVARCAGGHHHVPLSITSALSAYCQASRLVWSSSAKRGETVAIQRRHRRGRQHTLPHWPKRAAAGSSAARADLTNLPCMRSRNYADAW